MKAFLIDPAAKTVTEVEYSGNWQDIYPLTDCDCFTTVDIDGANTMFLDDEGLLKGHRDDFFVYGPECQPLAGKALVLGYDEEGETVASSLTIQEIVSQVKWMDAQTALRWVS
jgi:hypothetical protein